MAAIQRVRLEKRVDDGSCVTETKTETVPGLQHTRKYHSLS